MLQRLPKILIKLGFWATGFTDAVRCPDLFGWCVRFAFLTGVNIENNDLIFFFFFYEQSPVQI